MYTGCPGGVIMCRRIHDDLKLLNYRDTRCTFVSDFSIRALEYIRYQSIILFIYIYNTIYISIYQVAIACANNHYSMLYFP